MFALQSKFHAFLSAYFIAKLKNRESLFSYVDR